MGRANATIRASCLGVRQSLLEETVMSTRVPVEVDVRRVAHASAGAGNEPNVLAELALTAVQDHLGRLVVR
jgi:hypothetical protein